MSQADGENQTIVLSSLHWTIHHAATLDRALSATTLVVVLVRRHSAPLPVSSNSGVDRSQALETGSVLSNSGSNSLGVDLKRVPCQVSDVITCLVVVHIVRNTSLATEELGLLLGLDDFGASEQTAGSDAAVKEASVITAATEVGGDRVLAIGGEELLKEDLSLSTARWAGLVESTSVAIVDAENVVGRSDHVEVEVQADLGSLFSGELIGVVIAAEQAELLSGPESETDGVVDGVTCKLFCDLEYAYDAGAVVVDARSVEDRVGVATDDQD
jgi:hypothetical protein